MANPRHIYAVRHAERVDDINEVWYFNSRFLRDNPPLSELGEKQAEELKKRFRKTHIDFCFTSPYERCVQTACKILEGRMNGCKINVEPGFLESGNLVFERGADKPSFEKSKELADRYPMINLNYNQLFLSQAPEEFNKKAGIKCCFSRIHHTLNQLVKCCQGDILIVTHKHPMAAIQSFLVPETQNHELNYPGPATVSKFEEQPGREYNGRPVFTAAYLGDNSHLSDLGKSIDLRVK